MSLWTLPGVLPFAELPLEVCNYLWLSRHLSWVPHWTPRLCQSCHEFPGSACRSLCVPALLLLPVKSGCVDWGARRLLSMSTTSSFWLLLWVRFSLTGCEYDKCSINNWIWEIAGLLRSLADMQTPFGSVKPQGGLTQRAFVCRVASVSTHSRWHCFRKSRLHGAME